MFGKNVEIFELDNDILHILHIYIYIMIYFTYYFTCYYIMKYCDKRIINLLAAFCKYVSLSKLFKVIENESLSF